MFPSRQFNRLSPPLGVAVAGETKESTSGARLAIPVDARNAECDDVDHPHEVLRHTRSATARESALGCKEKVVATSTRETERLAVGSIAWLGVLVIVWC